MVTIENSLDSITDVEQQEIRLSWSKKEELIKYIVRYSGAVYAEGLAEGLAAGTASHEKYKIDAQDCYAKLLDFIYKKL